MNKPFCVIPFTQAFVLPDGSYRDCCATAPAVISRPDDTFDTWWHGDDLNGVRDHMQSKKDHPRCNSCIVQEQIHNISFRLSVNKDFDNVSNDQYPSRWTVTVGNKCNLACWSCSEQFSSTIARHKKQINILPLDFVDPSQTFNNKWPVLKEHILKSYNFHSAITINLLGGEPVYNKHIIEFLSHLVETGLSKATRLEITTNGTIMNKKLLKLLNKARWKHISIFISVDAIGPKAEWLRYGCNWDTVNRNIDYYRRIVSYVELHTVLSILNINDLSAVEKYAQEKNISNRVTLLNNPNYLDIRSWDGDKSMINCSSKYVDMIGISSKTGTKQELKNYIEQFTNRTHLNLVDPLLATAIGI